MQVNEPLILCLIWYEMFIIRKFSIWKFLLAPALFHFLINTAEVDSVWAPRIPLFTSPNWKSSLWNRAALQRGKQQQFLLSPTGGKSQGTNLWFLFQTVTPSAGTLKSQFWAEQFMRQGTTGCSIHAPSSLIATAPDDWYHVKWAIIQLKHCRQRSFCLSWLQKEYFLMESVHSP